VAEWEPSGRQQEEQAVSTVARRRTSAAVRWVAGAAAVLALAAGCTSGGSAGGGGTGSGPTAEAGPVTVEITPAKGAASVSPRDRVVVTAKGGTLSDVTVSGGVSGSLDAARTTWTSKSQLDFARTYTVTVQAADAGGAKTTSTSTFSTVDATAQVFPAVSPLRGTTVGVGMPIRVYFDAPVTDKKAALAHMNVATSKPTEGGWHWFSDTEVHWRPKTYWASGTQVALDTDLYGVKLGDGVYGGAKANRHIEFAIGRSQVSVADARTHQFKVYVEGKLVKTFPASLGKEVKGRYTHSGAHVVTEKKRSMTMDSTTYGLALDAGGYRTKVEFATRISNSGEFVHSAPWSVAQQGRQNVSHGCINLSPANAAWFYGIANPGDVVEVRGTPVPLTSKDTDIPDWTIPWSEWGE
jgi:lipoprotein-anchoring transpeptidase ErfK/SrfK